MGKSTISMVIFNSYVSSPEGNISFDQLPQRQGHVKIPPSLGTEAELEEVDGHESQQHQTCEVGCFLTKRTVKDV